MERPRNNEQTNGNKYPKCSDFDFQKSFSNFKKRKRKETGVLENGADSSFGTRYAQDESEIPDSKKAIEDY